MSERLPIGELFEGRYRVDGELGAGGFAVVYAARDMQEDRDVALKVLTLGRGPQDRPARQRFRLEIEVVAQLESPHTVRLYGHGESAAGAPYAVFERVRGRDLGELLAERGRLDPAETVHVLRQVLMALDEAHRRGLLHRDVKPENVRVDESLGAKLLDFGIARQSDSGPSITQTGELVGTPRYMSPEQLTNKPLGPESDIYSLGIVAFEMLMGRDALAGNSWVEQLDRLQSGHVFSVPALERVGPDLLKVVERMTARQPRDRFPSASAVLAALDGAAALDEARTTRLPAVGPAPAPPRRRNGRGMVVVALCAAATVVGVLAGMMLLMRRPPVEAPPQVASGAVPSVLLETRESVDEPAAAVVDAALVDVAPDVGIVDAGPPSGCGRLAPFVGRQAVGGDDSYAYAPKSYAPDTPAPLVILLHQTFESAGDFLRVSGFEQLSEEKGFLVIAPQHGDLFDSWKSEDRDLPTVRRALDLMTANFCVDPERVYLVANGHGGRVAMLASCEPWIAATAIHAYGNSDRTHHCYESEPAPHLLITPTHSPHVPVNGGKSCSMRAFDEGDTVKMAVSEIEARWRKRNGCGARGEVVFAEAGSGCRRWSCTSPFQSCLVRGGNGWTGSQPRPVADSPPCGGPPPTKVRLAPIVWSFFEHATPK